MRRCAAAEAIRGARSWRKPKIGWGPSMMTGRMAAERSEWDGERARRVFEEANARYEASKHIGARFRGTRTDVRFWHKADIQPSPGNVRFWG